MGHGSCVPIPGEGVCLLHPHAVYRAWGWGAGALSPLSTPSVFLPFHVPLEDGHSAVTVLKKDVEVLSTSWVLLCFLFAAAFASSFWGPLLWCSPA